MSCRVEVAGDEKQPMLVLLFRKMSHTLGIEMLTAALLRESACVDGMQWCKGVKE